MYNRENPQVNELLDFSILVSDRESSSFHDTTNVFDCLDHKYFEEEIKKLIHLRTDIEKDRFHRKVFNKDPNLQINIDLEWNCLKQIELRLFDLEDLIFSMKRFEPEKMVKEVHEITETLIKIKAGRMTASEFNDMSLEDSINHISNTHNYAQYNQEEEYYEDDYGMEDYGDEFGQEYGLENCKYVQKTQKKNKKPSNT